MKILIATGNKGKAAEYQRIFQPFGFTVLMPADAGVAADAEENGETFAENAKIKALDLYNKTGITTLADDSGLCIDALGGKPGVHTARYGGDISYRDRFQLVFRELDGVLEEKRTAHFQCSICCVFAQDDIIEVSEKCEGHIGFVPKGTDGFGYDPIFYVGDRSFGEFSADEKDKVSHRGKAVRSFIKKLEERQKKEIL